ncbi:MAG: hypothetical protein U0768_10410 [Anaerolineae bacterium]
MERPTGVTILAWLAILWGIIEIIWSFIVMGFASIGWLTGVIFSQGLQNWGASALWGGLAALVGAVILIIVGFGALRLRPWAWLLGVIAVVINLIPPILSILNGSWFWGIIGLIIPGILAYYLFSPGVRRAFGRA